MSASRSEKPIDRAASEGLRFEFRPVIVNVGQTPAYFLNNVAALHFVRVDDIPTFDFEGNLPPIEEQTGVLTLGSTQNRFMSVVLDRALTKAELRQYRCGTHILMVFGKVVYQDAFQRNHYTNFSFAISACNKRSAHLWRTTYRHNDSN
jgi:hypothetical protein